MSTILIVEDDPGLLRTLKAKLEKAGYEVETAQDGEEALRLIREKPDAVLLDLLLPQKTGIEVLEDLQKSKDLLSIPIIVISNSGQQVEIERVKRLGAKDFLVKTDFTPQDVLDKLSRFVPLPANSGSSKKKEAAPHFPATEKYEETNKGTVLIVEDDSFLRKLLVEKLKREGFSIKEAASGKEALESVSREIPMVVLLDLVMPGADGFQVLQELRKEERTKNIPVIVLSNLGEQENIDRAKSLGADDYMVKAHFILDEIVERVSNLIAKRYI